MKFARLQTLKKMVLTALALANVVILFHRAMESGRGPGLLTRTTNSNLPAAERGNPR